MKDVQKYKLKPYTSVCAGVCTWTFMLGFLSILCGITENIIQFVYIGIVFAIINVIVVIFTIGKWNSFVYIDDEKITQYQWKKEIIIYYDKIDKVKYFKYRDKPYEPRISLYSNGNKITFGEIYVLPKFLEKCSSEKVKNEINDEIKKASKMRYRHIDLN